MKLIPKNLHPADPIDIQWLDRIQALNNPFNQYNTKDVKFLQFLKTLPKNLSTPTEKYRIYDYWKASGSPSNFNEALNREEPMFFKMEDGYHAPSLVTINGTEESLKRNDHSTEWMNMHAFYNDPELKQYRNTHIPINTTNPYGYTKFLKTK